MSTTDDIMALAAAMLRAGPNYDGTISELRSAVAALVAERDALKAESLLWSHRAGEDAAQHRKTVEERDALRQDADKWKAINMLWSFPGKTLEQVLKMRADELAEIAGEQK